MTTKLRRKPADDDAGKTDPPKGAGDDAGGGDGDGDDDDGVVTRGDLQEMIDAAVATRLAGDDDKGKGKGDAGDDDKGTKRTTLRDDEDEMRRRVESEVKDVAWREGVVAQLGKLAEATKPVETPPVRRSLRHRFWV